MYLIPTRLLNGIVCIQQEDSTLGELSNKNNNYVKQLIDLLLPITQKYNKLEIWMLS